MITLAESKALWNNKLYVFYCPMKKANWLDDANTVKNPYYGKSMLTCGSVKKTIN
jgi:Cu(I)/Ag(I) efflux system membrane fusion protein